MITHLFGINAIIINLFEKKYLIKITILNLLFINKININIINI